ncbi:MAG: hypothetical protein M3Q71_13280 [Chloroflexota bacterium]|nr:hypothetical protein [Chloroflexota bacterium]MDP9471617.1 hypothetical protein [Chloroflexota bacterium]
MGDNASAVKGWRRLSDGSETAEPNAVDAQRLHRSLKRDWSAVEQDSSIKQAYLRLHAAYHRPFARATEMIEAEDTEAGEFLDAVVGQFLAAVDREAIACGPREVLFGTRRAFLIMNIAPRPLWDVIDRSFGEPITLRVNRTDHPLPIPDLRPGEFVMRFTRASGRDRDAYTSLITEMQAALEYPTTGGGIGRPTIKEDPAMAEQAKAALKLAWMGLSNDAIASFFGWPGSDEAIAKRVADYIAAGAELLNVSDPQWPGAHSVPRLRRPQRSLNWPVKK